MQNELGRSAKTAKLRCHANNDGRNYDPTFLLKTSMWGLLIAASVTGLTTNSGAIWAASLIVMGSAFAHGIELQHQCLHNTGFRHRWLNELFGVILGLPMLVSFYRYRTEHLRHHKTVGTESDRGFFDYGTNAGSLRRFLAMFGLPRMKALGSDILRVAIGGTPKGLVTRRGDMQKVRRDYLMFFAVVTMAFALWLVLPNCRPLLVAGIVSWIVIGEPLHYLIEFPEHFGCHRSTDPFANTRTITSNRFMFWFTNGNNFHVEHHLKPSMPINELPNIYQENAGKHAFHDAGYADFFRRVLLLRSKTHVDSDVRHAL